MITKEIYNGIFYKQGCNNKNIIKTSIDKIIALRSMIISLIISSHAIGYRTDDRC